MKIKHLATFAVIAGVAVVIGLNTQRKPALKPIYQDVVTKQQVLSTNHDGSTEIEATMQQGVAIQIPDGDYKVSYITGLYSKETGPHWRFGLYRPSTNDDLDFRHLDPASFTFEEKTSFAEGYTVRVSKNGTHIQAIADARRGPDYKGPFMTIPDWLKNGTPVTIKTK